MDSLNDTSVLNYVRNVLGVKSVPKATAVPTHWKVAFISETALGDQESQLVAKIASAMKLEPEDWFLVHENWAKQITQIEKSEFIVCFSHDLYKNLKINFPQLSLFEIPSPQKMIAAPNLKKQAWDILRSILPSGT